jgi:type IV pilus assembly protein PilV
MATYCTQRGALLVEALVAIVVFSVGVLGNVALHAQAMRHVGEAHYRSEAAALAQSVLARMWAEDPAGLAARYGDGHGTGYDAFAGLARRLPGAQLSGNAPEVRIEAGPSAASRRVTVVLRWQAPGESAPHRHATTAIMGGNG